VHIIKKKEKEQRRPKGKHYSAKKDEPKDARLGRRKDYGRKGRNKRKPPKPIKRAASAMQEKKSKKAGLTEQEKNILPEKNLSLWRGKDPQKEGSQHYPEKRKEKSPPKKRESSRGKS